MWRSRAARSNRSPESTLIDAALEAGVLQPVEAQTLREAEAARRKVIDVDDFDKEELALAEGKVR